MAIHNGNNQVRLRQRSILKTVVLGIIATLAVGGLSAIVAPAASAGTGLVYHAVDADRANDGGVFFRSSANWGDTSRTPGRGMYYNESAELICGAWGESVGPYANRRWHLVKNLSHDAGIGWIPDRYMDTPNAANQGTPGEPECTTNYGGGGTNGSNFGGVVLASAPKQRTSFQGIDLGFSQAPGKHGWGNCLVEDFKDGQYGWTILSYTGGPYLVRNGMLFGWFDNGGAPGMGCPTSREYGYLGGTRQDFTGGSLYWYSGMDHATRIDAGREGALNWAMGRLGQAAYVHQCLEFVVSAYNFGIYGRDAALKGGPYGGNVRAYQWWDSHRSVQQGGTNPPRGAFVHWSPGATGDGSGHVVISMGGGLAITTQWAGSNQIRVIRIADYPAYYQGWYLP